MILMPVQVGMDKAINNLTVPLGQLREEIMVCPRHSLRPHLLWDLDECCTFAFSVMTLS